MKSLVYILLVEERKKSRDEFWICFGGNHFDEKCEVNGNVNKRSQTFLIEVRVI